VVVSRADIPEIFERVLYPVLEVLIVAPVSIETTEIRLRASVLLCKAFMRFEVSDNIAGEDVTECWMQVLDYLGRLMQIDHSEQLVRFVFSFDTRNGRLIRVGQSEAVHESLKNVILVMHAAGMLIPPLTEEHGDSRDEGQLWHITHDKIEQFIPGFMESVIPLSPPVPSSVELSATSVPTAEVLEPPPLIVVQPPMATEPIEGTSVV
jgi:brefeldin A-resistance guanine nucleotide exchange factor 1